MTDEQKYQLEKVIKLVRDSISLNASGKSKSIWLGVAGNYCYEIANKIKNEA